MLFSISVIVMSGLFLGWVCKKIRFPSLFGMIIAGILIGPGMLNLIAPSILDISTEIRKIALVVILIRAGLKLNLEDLKKVGRPAILMCFVPACFEIVGMVVLAPVLLGVSILDAAIIGAVIGAVSPAVIVPRMIKLIDEGYGTGQGIPQMILAGASVDDVFVIVMFTTFTGLAQGGTVSFIRFFTIPISILTGIVMGMIIGFLFAKWFSRVKIRATVMSIMVLSAAFALSAFEDRFKMIPFASLIAIMAMGAGIKKWGSDLSRKLSEKYDKMWVVAEIFLFVLVGASVAIDRLSAAGVRMILLVFGVLVFRMMGVFVCMLGTELKRKEKLFCMIAYMPKATVQAAIGGLPLAMGLTCGQTALTVSVIAILLTAPLGAFGIDLTYQRLLRKRQVS